MTRVLGPERQVASRTANAPSQNDPAKGSRSPTVAWVGRRRNGAGPRGVGPTTSHYNLMKPESARPSSSSLPPGLSRRDFLRAALGSAAGASLVGMLPNRAVAAARNKRLPTPQQSGVEHIVVVMMENRSYDHLLGWLPNSDGRQAGLTYFDRNGVGFPTLPLAPDYQGCGHPDPDHSYEGGRIELNNGACDGWLRAGLNDAYAIGYYTQADVPFLGSAALNWTACDRYFTSIMAGTFPNRIYQHAAATDRLENSLAPICTLPTIWDRLAEHSLTGRYYFSDFPFLALWGTKYLSISRHASQFFADCAAGTLPQVSFNEPRLFGEAEGISNE
jgi:phospholipase C